MSEIPKRVPLKPSTVRELYLKSGNRCAFPDCPQPLFTAGGEFVGEICHIEAAEPGGERFNQAQTNEERRHVSNLILLCRNHHAVTNNIEQYSVERMKRIKAEHENLFSDVVRTMLRSVKDHTTLSAPKLPVNLLRMSKMFNWNLTDEQLQESLAELLPVLKTFSKIPLPTREFFCVLVLRGKNAGLEADLQVPEKEIEQALNISTEEVKGYLTILKRESFVDMTEDEWNMSIINVPRLRSSWRLWTDLRDFCAKNSLELALMLVNLDFTPLDSMPNSSPMP